MKRPASAHGRATTPSAAPHEKRSQERSVRRTRQCRSCEPSTSSTVRTVNTPSSKPTLRTNNWAGCWRSRPACCEPRRRWTSRTSSFCAVDRFRTPLPGHPLRIGSHAPAGRPGQRAVRRGHPHGRTRKLSIDRATAGALGAKHLRRTHISCACRPLAPSRKFAATPVPAHPVAARGPLEPANTARRDRRSQRRAVSASTASARRNDSPSTAKALQCSPMPW